MTETEQRKAEYRLAVEEVVSGLGCDPRRCRFWRRRYSGSTRSPAARPRPLARRAPATSPTRAPFSFTTLMLFQLFNVPNARSDERSAFHGLFTNPWLWAAALLSLLLQFLVVYAPFMQPAFGTVASSLGDWLVCAAVASSVLWLREASKLVVRAGS